MAKPDMILHYMLTSDWGMGNNGNIFSSKMDRGCCVEVWNIKCN